MTDASKTTALLLAHMGLDRFYTCGVGMGILKVVVSMLTLGLWGIWDVLVLMGESVTETTVPGSLYFGCSSLAQWRPDSIHNAKVTAYVLMSFWLAMVIAVAVAHKKLGLSKGRRRRLAWQAQQRQRQQAR